jgi:hypothetical protein
MRAKLSGCGCTSRAFPNPPPAIARQGGRVTGVFARVSLAAVFRPYPSLQLPMKKCVLPAALALTFAGLSGCPIYDDDDTGCVDDLDCAAGELCDDASRTCYDEDETIACDRPSDCGVNETCDRTGTCTIGDCHFPSVGCVQGFVCSSSSGRWECESDDGGQGGSGGMPAMSGGAAGEAGGPLSSAGQGGESI